MLPSMLAVRRTLIFSIICFGLVAYVSSALFLRPAGALVSAHGSKPTTVVLDDGTAVGQSFRAQADGLDGIVLHVRRMDAPLEATLDCELLQAKNGAFRSVYRWRQLLALPASGGSQRFALAPVEKSNGEAFRFIMRLAAPGAKVPFEASMDNAFDGGAMIVDGREEWGDLVFETSAIGSTGFGRFRMMATQLPAALRPAWIQVGLLALFVWAWLCIFHWLFIARPEPS